MIFFLILKVALIQLSDKYCYKYPIYKYNCYK